MKSIEDLVKTLHRMVEKGHMSWDDRIERLFIDDEGFQELAIKPPEPVNVDPLGPKRFFGVDYGHTDRGFEIVSFRDRHGEACLLQQSGLADYAQPGTSAVWLGRVSGGRMHLDLEQATVLRNLLTRWIQTGSFQSSPESAASGSDEN